MKHSLTGTPHLLQSPNLAPIWPNLAHNSTADKGSIIFFPWVSSELQTRKVPIFRFMDALSAGEFREFVRLINKISYLWLLVLACTLSVSSAASKKPQQIMKLEASRSARLTFGQLVQYFTCLQRLQNCNFWCPLASEKSFPLLGFELSTKNVRCLL